MIKINLIPREALEQEARKQVIILAGLGGVVVLSLAIILLAARILVQKNLVSELNSLENEIAKYQTVVNEVKKIKEANAALEAKKSIIERLMKDRLLYPKFMEEFIELLPSSVWVTSLNTTLDTGIPNGFKMNFVCTAFDVFDVANLIDNLEKSQKFSKVEVGTINSSPAGEREIIQFTINCEYRVG